VNRLILFIAQGFGVGRIPVAPGTFGSVLGLGWFALLLRTGNFWEFLGGIILGLALSVWLCGTGEKILNQKDPGSVVMDEIAAMPLCFLGLILHEFFKHGTLLPLSFFFSRSGWWILLLGFGAFRLFDIWKPWPVRQSQNLPGGWGVTVDDALAAVYVNLLFFLFILAWTHWLHPFEI
jgi:phosphatidylglycerophosphatase A